MMMQQHQHQQQQPQQASTDEDSQSGSVPPPPQHDFAFFEWNFDGTQQSSNAGEKDHVTGGDDTPPPLPSKPSIEDLMASSIYKSLLSRELGGATDLEWSAYRGVPRDVIELDNHRAVSSGHATATGPSRQEKQRREFVESRLRRTAPPEALPRRATHPGGISDRTITAFKRAGTTSAVGSRSGGSETKRVHKLLSRLSLKKKRSDDANSN